MDLNNQNIKNNQSAQNNLNTRNTRNTQNTPNTPIIPKSPKSQYTFLPRRGHYRNLRVYQVAEIIYDITFFFVNRYLSNGDRTTDQMIQAARSGKQNIAEGNQAAATSGETEIKLTNVAKAGLEELLTDYEDYLRVHQLQQWSKTHPRYETMRRYAQGEQIKTDYKQQIDRMNDEEIANLAITLIHQANYMLHKLLITMQERFVKEGGIRERMYRARTEYRNNQNNLNNQNNPNTQITPNTRNTQITQNVPNNQNTPNTPITQNTQKLSE